MEEEDDTMDDFLKPTQVRKRTVAGTSADGSGSDTVSASSSGEANGVGSSSVKNKKKKVVFVEPEEVFMESQDMLDSQDDSDWRM